MIKALSASILLCTLAAAQDVVFEAKTDAYLQPYLAGKNFSGSVLIVKGNKVLLRKGYGLASQELKVPNKPETRFHVASISKSITAAAVLLLSEKGKLKLDDAVATYVKDYPPGEKITVQHLLTHTSGIPNINEFPDYDDFSRFPHTPEELVAKFKDKPPEFAPGSKYAYSNSNYNLLARIIEVVSQQPYGDFLRTSIFAPLGMNSSGHDDHAAEIIPDEAQGYAPRGADQLEDAPYLDWSNKAGNGSLYTALDDLHRFMRAMLDGKLLSKATRDAIWVEKPGNNYGWFVRKRNDRLVISTNGMSPGFASAMDFYPQENLLVIVLGNLYLTAAQSPIATDLALIALGEQPKGKPFAPKTISAEELKKYVGNYRFGEDFFRGPIPVKTLVEDGTLLLDWGNDYRTPLTPLGNNEFLIRRFWARMVFAEGNLIYRDDKDFIAKRQ